MRKISILVLFAFVICFTNCKDEPNISYKYLHEDKLFECSDIDTDLIKEAVYAFENYIKVHYSLRAPKSLNQGYYFYWEISKTSRIPAVEFINEDLLAIRDELKKIEDLWIIEGDKAKFNTNHPLAKCIGENLMDPRMKNTYNVLVDSKTFKSNVFLSLLERNPVATRKDKALCTYLALETFYARILTLDFDNMEELVKLNRDQYNEDQKQSIKDNLDGFEETLTPVDTQDLKN